MNWPLLEMSMRLQGSETPKVHCGAQRRDCRGHVVVTCTGRLGHDGTRHYDAHAARGWEDA